MSPHSQPSQDGMVEPRESEHFEFYTPGQSDVILPLKESPIYVEDRIGLKALDEAGGLHLLSVEVTQGSNHCHCPFPG